jgi:glutamine cyclotransferase
VRKRSRQQNHARQLQPPGPGKAPLVRWTVLVTLATSALPGWAPVTRAEQSVEAPPVYGYEIVNTYPHDPAAFSQGLVFRDGFLYEGTGRYGQSSLRQVDLESGRVLKFTSLSPRLFGEGITFSGDDLVQLTWRSGIGIVYDGQSFGRRGMFRYPGEGWGITTVGERLVMSDGSAKLRFLDPKTYRVVKTVAVRSQGKPVNQLNELEYVGGEIYANVWGSDRIVRISPETGQVLGWIDLAGLLPLRQRVSRDAVLNGIAYDAEGKRLFVTGKLWPKLFEIRLVRKR